MSQSDKAAYYKELKDAGVEFKKHYRDYSTAELKEAVDKLREERPIPPAPEAVEPELTPEEAARFFGQGEAQPATHAAARMPERHEAPPVAPKDESEMPGQRQNLNAEMQPIRTDEQGRIWYQEEVQKPSFAKPRGRRVLQYMDTGVQEKTVVGEDGTVETFEISGTQQRRPSEVKITLPSYQVGIYKDRRFPFKIHTYNGMQGFDLFEVQDYYGGSELVPRSVKRMYVENVLCYDIRTVVRAIQDEYRQLQLTGKVR